MLIRCRFISISASSFTGSFHCDRFLSRRFSFFLRATRSRWRRRPLPKLRMMMADQTRASTVMAIERTEKIVRDCMSRRFSPIPPNSSGSHRSHLVHLLEGFFVLVYPDSLIDKVSASSSQCGHESGLLGFRLSRQPRSRVGDVTTELTMRT